MDESRSVVRRYRAVAVDGVLLVVAALAVWNFVDNRYLSPQRSRVSQGEDLLMPGDPLPTIPLLDSEGIRSELSQARGRRGGAVAVLTTTCPYCEQALPLWSELAAGLEEHGFEFIGVSLDPPAPTNEYGKQNGIDWLLSATLTGREGARVLRVRTVPFTVLYGSDGTVLQTWTGPLQIHDIETIWTKLGIR